MAGTSRSELFASEVLGKRLPWSKVLDGRFSVIVGRANFGKTMKLKAKSKALRADGKAAIYIALHKVLGEDVFADALDVEDRTTPKKPHNKPDVHAGLLPYCENRDLS